MEQDTNTQEAPAQEAVVGLTLQDLRVLAGSVELGATRGAYRAPEMEVIGATYNKLASFLAANAPKEPETQDTPDEAQNTEVTETADSAE
jgi:hypothetical protein